MDDQVRIPAVAGFARRAAGAQPGPHPPPQPRSPKGVGKELRARVPRSSHGALAPGRRRPDAVQAVEESNRGRVPDLVPIRVARMSATPFAFLRGAAGLMAYDLAGTPVTGVAAQICGDAHAANFGLYGDARGRLVIDLNDFDETETGPWEWDLKRLAASLVLAGRQAGADEDTCRAAAFDTVGAYRRTMRLLAKLPVHDAWNAIADEELVSHADAHDLAGTLERVSEKARSNTSARFAAKATEECGDGSRRFVDAPPVLRRVPDVEAATVAGSLAEYLGTLPHDRLPLLARYAIHDVAFRVVGTGSVGTRSYVVLLLDHRDEPLVLQVKEARASALLPYLPAAGFPSGRPEHHGRRVVLGQQRMQVVSDSLLGWTTVEEAVPGAAVQEPQGQRGPGCSRGRPGGRLRPDDRRAACAGPCAQRGSAADSRVLRKERGAGRGGGRVRRGLRGPYGGGSRGSGGSGAVRADGRRAGSVTREVRGARRLDG